MKRILITALLVFSNIYSVNASKLMITPTRLEFKGSNRVEEVRLINRSEEETTYRLSFQNLKMKEDGSYEEIKQEDVKGDENFAHKLVRFSPRRFTLKPGGVQIVRFMVKKPEDLRVGEYRSHALFNEEAPANFGANIENQNKQSDNISVVLKPLFGISIPVIVTHGEVEAKVEISDAQIKSDKKGQQFISMKLNRSGNASVYGDIVATLRANNSKEEYEVGSINGLSVFYPYSSRNVEMQINIPAHLNLKDSVVDVKYYKKESGSSSHDKNNILTQHQITVGVIKSRVNY